MTRKAKIIGLTLCTLALTTIAAPQVKEILKVLGVGAVVKQFGPDINKQINKITNHQDTKNSVTKVVPILSIGINGASSAIGAAQIMGPKAAVDSVEAVAQPEVKFADIRLRGLVPVATKDFKNGIKAVDGVGVSGVVDLKL